MRCFRLIMVLVLLHGGIDCFAQSSLLSLGFWNISALSGEIKAGGLYGIGTMNTYGINNKLTTYNYYGGIQLKTASYIWNPNFLTINADGGYYPESRQDLYLVTPNIYNTINTSKLHLSTVLFPKKLFSLSNYLNYDNSYDSRENLTDIKTKSKSWGGQFSLRNKLLPITMSYNQSKWDSKEILTGRDFYYDQKNINAHATKSFGLQDRTELDYTHNDYYRKDFSMIGIQNVSDNLSLINSIYLDSARKSQLNSTVFGTIQKGADNYKQLRENENFFLKLPRHFNFSSSYGYYYISRDPEVLQQHTFNAMLGHQLFQSLHTGLIFDYNYALESTYTEINRKGGIELNYIKKTFAGGLLNVMYNYHRVREVRTSNDELLVVKNEEYTISDRIMLKRPYINLNTIVVKDATGTIIYQQNLDYIVNSIGNFIEIQRVPGGLIQENANVFVFYTAVQPGNYQYDINLNNFSANWGLFNQLIDFYFKTNRNSYDNLKNSDNLILDHLTENIFGGSVKIKSANIGAEYDNYQSTLVPYVMMRYYLMWQGRYKSKLLYTINANWRDYKMPTEDQHRIYRDLNAMMAYSFNQRLRLDINIGYQSQEGRQINLNLYSLRTKLSRNLNQLTLVAGLDAYDRVYLENQKNSYLGVYIQVVKKFKY